MANNNVEVIVMPDNITAKEFKHVMRLIEEIEVSTDGKASTKLSDTESELMEKMVRLIRSGYTITVVTSDESYRAEDYFTGIKDYTPEVIVSTPSTPEAKTSTPNTKYIDSENSELEKMRKERVDAIHKKFAENVLISHPKDGFKTLPS